MSMFTRSNVIRCFLDDKLNCNSNWFNTNNHRTLLSPFDSIIKSSCFSLALLKSCNSLLFMDLWSHWERVGIKNIINVRDECINWISKITLFVCNGIKISAIDERILPFTRYTSINYHKCVRISQFYISSRL